MVRLRSVPDPRAGRLCRWAVVDVSTGRLLVGDLPDAESGWRIIRRLESE